MAKKYRYDLVRRIADRLLSWLIRRDLAPEGYYLLTTIGRRSSLRHTKPVAIVQNGEERWLVAPYGEVDWVHNARAAGEVTLSRGKQSEILTIEELAPTDRAAVLKQYLGRYPIVRPYFEVQADSPLESFEVEASWRPVFRLLAQSGGNGRHASELDRT